MRWFFVLLHFWRRSALCWWGGCGGVIDYDNRGTFWYCPRCGRVTR